MDKNFECTICLDTAKEPVLTKCGHIYCWPCIYNWLDSKGGKAKCPNCKNEITKNDLIPVYANDENKENTNRFKNILKGQKLEEIQILKEKISKEDFRISHLILVEDFFHL